MLLRIAVKIAVYIPRKNLNRLPFLSVKNLILIASSLFLFLITQSVKEYNRVEIALAECCNKHVRCTIWKLSVYLELKQNISIRENVSTSSVSFIFTFGKQKHFIFLFTFYLYKIGGKKEKRKILTAFPNKSVCAGCQKSFGRTVLYIYKFRTFTLWTLLTLNYNVSKG